MLVGTHRVGAAPVLAYCPRCKDRVRFDNVDINTIVCTCTFAAWKFSTNAVRLDSIRGRVTNHKCDAKCLYAKGPSCDCSCGGKNHGSGHGRAEAA